MPEISEKDQRSLLSTSPIFLTTAKGKKIRILTPYEFDAILKMAQYDHCRTLFNIAFYTGMRYVELQRLYKHPEYYQKDRSIIHLDRDAQRKVKRITPERNVPVPPQIIGELPYFFKNRRPPTRKVWNDDLKRWAKSAGVSENGEGIVPKMTRASIETWMYIAEIPPEDICLRQGHDAITSLNHYKALGSMFTTIEKQEIRNRLSGWH